MKLSLFFKGLVRLATAAAILLLGHYGYWWLAVAVVTVPVVIGWVRHGRTVESAISAASGLVFGLSIVVLISLSREPVGQSVFPVASQVGLALFYAGWLILRDNRVVSAVLTAGIYQAFSIAAIFLASAFWHWNELLVVVLTWLSAFIIAYTLLKQNGERASKLMAVTWGLIAAEIAWVLETWQVNYIIGGGYLIVPQASIVILGVGYCLASVYTTHAEKKLSRRRLIEYVAIAGLLLVIVIAGTRWNGTT